MYYEINVAKDGKHFFATDKRSITTESALKEVYQIIKAKFPEEEGYNIMVTYYETTGKFVDMDYLNTKDDAK